MYTYIALQISLFQSKGTQEPYQVSDDAPHMVKEELWMVLVLNYFVILYL